MAITLTLSCAASSDGYLDDRSPRRAILSSPEDLEAVLALRSRMDAIVVGAQTLRRDNPSLSTRGEIHHAARRSAERLPDPLKIVVSRSGEIPRNRKFFTDGDGEKIVLTGDFRNGGDLRTALAEIADERGLSDILVEGGASLLKLLMPVADTMRLAVSPRELSEAGHARLFVDLDTFLDPLYVTRTETLGDTDIHHVDLFITRARQLMNEAFDLSEQCPPSDTAFAVGAIGSDATLLPLASGYSRETGPKDHAEEALLSKIESLPHTVICTLEPCLSRASKPKGCAQRLVDAGVKRVIYAVSEDETFTTQSGLTYLRDNGVELIRLDGFEDRFRKANPLIYDPA